MARGARERERDARLRLIGYANDVGKRARLGKRPHDLAPRFEVGRHPGLVAALLGRPPDPCLDFGDHAERALGADDELPQGGACSAVRRLERAELPGGRGQGDRRDETVEAPVAA